MEITDITVNPNNYSDFDVSPEEYGRWHPKYSAAFDAHCSLNTYLDKKLGHIGRSDWGGKYNTWLRQFGIGPNSKNGWWSIEAVDPVNIQGFIRDYTADSDEDLAWQKKLYDGKEVFDVLSSLNIEIKNIDEIIEVFSELQLKK